MNNPLAEIVQLLTEIRDRLPLPNTFGDPGRVQKPVPATTVEAVFVPEVPAEVVQVFNREQIGQLATSFATSNLPASLVQAKSILTPFQIKSAEEMAQLGEPFPSVANVAEKDYAAVAKAFQTALAQVTK